MKRGPTSARLHLLLSGVIGLGFFAIPVPVQGRWTVVFDVVVKTARSEAEGLVSAFSLGLLLLGAVGTVAAMREHPRAGPWKTHPVIAALRLGGLVLGPILAFELGPSWLHTKGVGGLMWGVLAASVALLIPLGAAVLNVLVGYGLIELVGAWMRPLMRPAFRLPGRAALDDLMSWLGSYSVGLYMTRKLVDRGLYSRREAFLIVTGFSTVSIGFVGVVCSTLELLHLFPLVFATYFFVVYLLAAIQARIWPATAISDLTLGGEPSPPDPTGESGWSVALQKASSAPGVHRLLGTGLKEGTILASSVLGTILAVGTLATVIAEYSPVFQWLGAPLVPVLAALGLPDAPILAPAVLAGITEMYIPALLVRDAAIEGRFFIAVLSISQLVFFSSVAPMILDMFGDLPVRISHLLIIFVVRTALLIPLLALLVHLYGSLGWLVPG